MDYVHCVKIRCYYYYEYAVENSADGLTALMAINLKDADLQSNT